MGYAMNNAYAAGTTAAQLNQLQFLEADTPSVGTTTAGALLGSDVGPLGSNPTIASTLNNNTAQFIDYWVADTPEPSTAWFMIGGIATVAMLRRRTGTSM